MDTENGLSCCRSVANELNKVSKKIGDADCELTSIDGAISSIENLKRRIEEGLPDDADERRMLFHQMALQSNASCSKLSKSHKDVHGAISKFGKSIDKNFTSDYASVITTENEHIQEQLDRCVARHFLREGQLDVAQSIIDEAGLDIPEVLKQPFIELHRIISALQERDLEPAFQWVEEHHADLSGRGSALELNLQRLRYIQLLSEGPSRQQQALCYIRNVAANNPCAASHLQVLMAALMYVERGLENSPYASLLEPSQWHDVQQLFVKEYCTLLNLPQSSPLALSVRVGCLGISPLLSIRSVLKNNEVQVWKSDDELPIEINPGPHTQFHSMFACPILRQRSSHNNPPMRLVCGHVISRDAVHRLATLNRIKCPYCPQDMVVTECRQIHF